LLSLLIGLFVIPDKTAHSWAECIAKYNLMIAAVSKFDTRDTIQDWRTATREPISIGTTKAHLQVDVRTIGAIAVLKPEQIAELRDLIAEGNRLLALGDKQAAATIQQRIEELKAAWRKAEM